MNKTELVRYDDQKSAKEPGRWVRAINIYARLLVAELAKKLGNVVLGTLGQGVRSLSEA